MAAHLRERLYDSRLVAVERHGWDDDGVGRGYAAAAADVEAVSALIDFIAKDCVDVKDVGKPKRAVIRAAMDLQACIKQRGVRFFARWVFARGSTVACTSATLEVDDLADVVVTGRDEAILNSSSVGRNMS